MRRMFIAPFLILGTLASAPALAADAGETPAAQQPAGGVRDAVRQAAQQAAEQAAARNGGPNNGDKAANGGVPPTQANPARGKGATPPRRNAKPIYGVITIHKR